MHMTMHARSAFCLLMTKLVITCREAAESMSFDVPCMLSCRSPAVQRHSLELAAPPQSQHSLVTFQHFSNQWIQTIW